MKGIYEVWGQGDNHEELEVAIRKFPEERMSPYLTEDSTFRIIVDSFGKVISFQEQNERIEGLSYIPFKVRLIFSCLVSFLHTFIMSGNCIYIIYLILICLAITKISCI